MDKEALRTQFCAITGTPRETAEFYLEATGWKIVHAQNMFFESVGDDNDDGEEYDTGIPKREGGGSRAWEAVLDTLEEQQQQQQQQQPQQTDNRRMSVDSEDEEEYEDEDDDENDDEDQVDKTVDDHITKAVEPVKPATQEVATPTGAATAPAATAIRKSTDPGVVLKRAEAEYQKSPRQHHGEASKSTHTKDVFMGESKIWFNPVLSQKTIERALSSTSYWNEPY
eukprot:TRINITY_DN859_c0_g1_i1.p1 TRINITY_DN859_c0_g1~~TRINITY_DN859_c0_g1_i1.p1  ORF type:complete len:226 (+),score=79.73 TRINITY_DN859_c0_g1_i1:167-844(+)